ncbi:hypothetical protein [Microvirgula aerodenitrificans]|uniref:hypothetical protein n=1 Tax=Microvirgula aerodenitrificans TaxID=57480 RepID=UPI0028E7CD2F|nr:hypothetical protein [Microvirgula aerodenitrificans]
MSKEIVAEAIKAAPPVAVTTASLAGLSLAEWVSIATILYIGLQVGLLVPRYWREYRAWRDGSDETDAPGDAT